MYTIEVKCKSEFFFVFTFFLKKTRLLLHFLLELQIRKINFSNNKSDFLLFYTLGIQSMQ